MPDQPLDDGGVGPLATVVGPIEDAAKEVAPGLAKGAGRLRTAPALSVTALIALIKRGRGDRQGKLAVELAGDAAQERARQKYGE